MNSKLRNILAEAALDYSLSSRTDSKEVVITEAEKAIRQAVGDEMLELVGDLEPEEIRNVPIDMPVNYAALEMKITKARTRNDFRAELRQKIKEWTATKEPSK